jgi:hypothetical protein
MLQADAQAARPLRVSEVADLKTLITHVPHIFRK